MEHYFFSYLLKNLEEKDGQTRGRRSVSAYVVACLAVITLIKDCYKILKSHGKHFFFFHIIGTYWFIKYQGSF